MTKKQRIKIETLTRENLIDSGWTTNICGDEVLLANSSADHIYVITCQGYLTIAPSSYSLLS